MGMFKEALRTGFFEYSNLFHQYRERAQVQGGLHWDLVYRYIVTQVLLLAPIASHTSDHIWQKFLGNPKSVLLAQWPETSEPDMVLVKASEYLEDAARKFRLRLKAHMMPGKAKKGETAAIPQTPSHGLVWIAKTFPTWQSLILNTMHTLYKSNNNVLPDNKEISKALGANPQLKKYMKKAMPFAQAVKERMGTLGEKALKATVDFNEREILEENIEYLRGSLELEGLEFDFTENSDQERTREDVVPGEPFLTLSTAPNILLTLGNPQPHLGLFTYQLPIYQDDNVAAIIARLRRQERAVKPSMNVTLHRYVDANIGPRILPALSEPLNGTVQLTENARFTHKEGQVHFTLNGTAAPLGAKILYVVN